MSRPIRKQERVPIKMTELKTIGSNISQPFVEQYAGSPEKIWDSKEECEEFMRNVTVPVLLLYGTDDILLLDHFDNTIKAFMTIRGNKCVFLHE